MNNPSTNLQPEQVVEAVKEAPTAISEAISDSNAKPEPKYKKYLIPSLMIVIVILLGIVAFFVYQMQMENKSIEPEPTLAPSTTTTEGAPTATPTSTPGDEATATSSPTIDEEQTDPSTPTPTPVADNQPTYTNEQYGISLTYAEPYKLLTSKDDLYGWPNGIALLYAGGQAYDIAIQVWDSQAEYEAEYGPRASELVVYQHNGKFITVLDNTKMPGNQAIIDSIQVGQE